MSPAAKIAMTLAAALVAACSSSSEVLLAQGEQQPSALAAQDGNAYWLAQATDTAPAAVRTISAKGGTPTTLAAIAGPRALALAAGDAIVGTTAGNVEDIKLATGALSVLIPKNSGDEVVAVAVSGDSVFAAFNSSRLARASISSGMSSVMELDYADNAVTAMAADATWLYWGTSSGDVFRQPADGSGGAVKLGTIIDASAVVPVGQPPIAATVFGGAAWFATKIDITRVDGASGALTTAVSFSSSCQPPRACTFDIWGISSSSAGLFVGLTHGVAKLDPASGATPIVAALNIDGTAVAADADRVYWIAGAQASTGTQELSNAIYAATF